MLRAAMGASSEILAFGVEPSRSPYYLRLARYQALAEDVAAFVRERQSTLDLLDVGVGRGRSMRFLDAQGVSPQIRYHGVDNSEHRLNEWLFMKERWRIEKADVEHGLPYADKSFDVVVCEQILEHLDKPRFVLGDICRVLRPGGLLVLGVPTFPPGVTHVRRFFVWAMHRFFGIRREHIQTFSSGDIVRWVRDTGCFTDISVRGFRAISGGPLRALERHAWWYRFNRRLGEIFPSLCVEVQVLARRTDAPAQRLSD